MSISNNCNSQSSSNINRKPAFAGQFYAANPDTLKRDLKNLFSQAVPNQCENTIAIISPHAGYVFSGKTAASAFNQIDKDKHYKNIFIITSSHRVSFDGASIYNAGNYTTPLGEVKVNTALANELIDKYSFFTYMEDADFQEHSIEVQLPFLQTVLDDSIQILPVIIAAQSLATIGKISNALKPYFNSENLFIISSDFSHYPKYDDAVRIDNSTVKVILNNNADTLIKKLNDNDRSLVKGLATSLCGWSSVITLLKLTENHKNITPKLIQINNSGDSDYGEKDRVVGYAAIAFTTDSQGIKSSNNEQKNIKNEFELTADEKKNLLNLVKKTLSNYIPNKKVDSLKKEDFSETLQEKLGVFVTLHKDNRLRGCIGRFNPNEPLYATVQEMAIAAATEDSRFKPVVASELNDIRIEISVLSPMKRISSPDEIVLGKHGIYIKKGNRSGTFLPQVATETAWDIEEFLGYCSRDKAGLGWDGWKDAELYVYSAFVFSE